jgi:hypothetical protein
MPLPISPAPKTHIFFISIITSAWTIEHSHDDRSIPMPVFASLNLFKPFSHGDLPTWGVNGSNPDGSSFSSQHPGFVPSTFDRKPD